MNRQSQQAIDTALRIGERIATSLERMVTTQEGGSQSWTGRTEATFTGDPEREVPPGAAVMGTRALLDELMGAGHLDAFTLTRVFELEETSDEDELHVAVYGEQVYAWLTSDDD